MPKLRFSPKTKRLFWGLAATLAIFSAVFTFTVQAINQAHYSQLTQAQITRMWTEPIPGSKGGEYLLLDYTFKAALSSGENVVIQQEGRIYYLGYYQTLQVHGLLPIRYDPNNPSNVFFPKDANPYDISLRFILPFLLLLGGMYCGFNFLWQ